MAQGFFPLDRQLETRGGWSEGAIEQVLWIAQAMSSYREAEEALQRLAHLKVPKTTIHRLVERYGRALAQQRQAEASTLWESGMKGEEPAPPREGQKAELGIGLDGVMVHVDGEWHEVKVGCCFEFGPGKEGEVEAQEVGYLAWYGEVEEFRRTMWGYAYHRGLGMEGKGVVIGDGAVWIDGFAKMYCPEGVRIVDWYHAVEHLWALGQEAHGEKATGWVERMKSHLWRGEVEAVVGGCEALLATRDGWSAEAARTAGYFRERADRMRYPKFRAAGYPIGSGTVESGCKGIGWRCKSRGQRLEGGKGLDRHLVPCESAGYGGGKKGVGTRALGKPFIRPRAGLDPPRDQKVGGTTPLSNLVRLLRCQGVFGSQGPRGKDFWGPPIWPGLAIFPAGAFGWLMLVC